MNVLDSANGHRRELVEHYKISGMGQFEQQLRRHRNTWHSLRAGNRVHGRIVKIVGRAVAPMWSLELGKALVHQLAGDATQVVERRLLDLAELLVVDEQQRRDDLEAVLRIQMLHVWQWSPVSGRDEMMADNLGWQCL